MKTSLLSICFMMIIASVSAAAAVAWASRLVIPITVTLSVNAIKDVFGYTDDKYYYWYAEKEVKQYTDKINDSISTPGEGILFEVEVLNLEGADSLILAPAPLGTGETPERVATQFLVGAPALPNELNSMMGAYIDSASKIREALGSGAEVSWKKTFRVWVTKTNDGKLEFQREPSDSKFLSSSIRRAKVRKLSHSLIKDLPIVESLALTQDRNAEMIEEYRTRAVKKKIYIEILELQKSRELAANEMRTALQLLESAKERQKTLSVIQTFQTLLTVGSIAYDYKTSADQAKAQERRINIQKGILDNQLSINTRLDSLDTTIKNLSKRVNDIDIKLSSDQQSINIYFIYYFGVDKSTLPEI